MLQHPRAEVRPGALCGQLLQCVCLTRQCDKADVGWLGLCADACGKAWAGAVELGAQGCVCTPFVL